MLTLRQIERLVMVRAWRRLLEGCLPRELAAGDQIVGMLAAQGGLEAAALGLGLQRACELSYSPTPIAARAAGRLLESQRADGHFSEGPGPGRAAATAIAVRALLEFRDLTWFLRSGARAGAVPPIDGAALDRALRALGRAAGAMTRPGAAGDVLEAKIILWQLGDRPEARAQIDFVALRRLVRESALPREQQPDAMTRIALAAA